MTKELSNILPDGITIEDFQNLNTDKLRAQMLKDAYILQAFLYSQAGHEAKRLGNSREILDTLEKDLFDENNFRGYSVEQKIRLFALVSTNTTNSLKFQQELHKSIANGLDTVKEIDRLNSKPIEITDDASSTKMKPLLNLLLRKLKEKNAVQ
jgi:hypothetical protein